MANTNNVIIGIIVVVVFLVAIGFAAYYAYYRYMEDHRKDQAVSEQLPARSSLRITASIRGNLVRTYNHPIESDYVIFPDKELGKGGVGVVYVGQKKDNNAYYAIKYVNKIAYEREVARLERELKLLKDVDHTNIVRLFSVYNLPEKMFFVMELCTGGHLGNFLSRQPQKRLPEEWARKLCLQLISAVSHIHSKGICHRDIKLQNILMDHSHDSTAQVKLIDFGYGAKFFGNLPMRTKCGTPYTTAPEVLRECYDERCDVWSVGVVLYIMLSGRRPFETLEVAGGLKEAGRAAMIASILACRYHFDHPTFRTVSDEAKVFVQKLLLPDYLERMTSEEALEYPWLRSKGPSNLEYNAHLMHISTSSKGSRAINNMKVSAWNAAKNLPMVPLAFSLNANQTAEIRALFQSFDRDCSGSLSRDEYVKAMAVLSPDLNFFDVNHLFDIIDIDNDGTISYTEFVAATLDPRGIDIEQLNEAFKLMDAGGKGFITFDDIQRMLNVETELFVSPASAPALPLLNLPAPQSTTPNSRRYVKASPSSHKLTSSGSVSQNPQHPPMKTGRRPAGSSSHSRRASQSEREREPSEREAGLSMMLKSPSRAAASAAAALGFTFGFGSDDNNNNNNDDRLGRRQRSVASDYSRGVHRSSDHRLESTGINDDADADNPYDEELNPKAIMAKRIRDMITLFDADNDGVISYDEFLWAMTGAGKLYGTDLPENFVNKKRRLPNNPSYSNKGKGSMFVTRNFSKNSPISRSTSSSGNLNALGSEMAKPDKVFQSEAIVSYVSTFKPEHQSGKGDIATIEELKEGNDSSEVILPNISTEQIEQQPKQQTPTNSIHASTAIEGSNKAVKSAEIQHPLDGETIATLPVYRRSSIETGGLGNVLPSARSATNVLALEPVVDDEVKGKPDTDNQSLKAGAMEKANSGILGSLSGLLGIASTSGKGSGRSPSFLGLRKKSSKINAIAPYSRPDAVSSKFETSIAIADACTVHEDPTDLTLLSKHPSFKGGTLPAITSNPDSENNSGVMKDSNASSNQSDKARKSSALTSACTLDELLAMTTSVDIAATQSSVLGKNDSFQQPKIQPLQSSNNSEFDRPLVTIPSKKYSIKHKQEDALHLRLTSPQVIQPRDNVSASCRSTRQTPSPMPTTQFTSPFSQAAHNVLKS